MPEFFIGLMSGTSLDGVDAVLADFSSSAAATQVHVHRPFESPLRDELLALNSAGPNEVERVALAGNELARCYAGAVEELLTQSGKKAADIQAIGCHGQTIRHRPDRGYTVQIGNAALLAELTGIRVVADFRSRDVAAGGQGAPIAPAFHAAMFGSASEDRAVLNLGGIANLTVLPRKGDVLGFDTGPGNCLMDLWTAQRLGKRFDEDGAWAAGGKVRQDLLIAMMKEPFFSAPAPKSTGRDLFNEPWLARHAVAGIEPRDVQATLLELTARSVADAVAAQGSRPVRLIACGGGTRNAALMHRLGALVSPVQVEVSSTYGIDPQQVEAIAFAWLARQALKGASGNLPAVTGARGLRILGAIHSGPA